MTEEHKKAITEGRAKARAEKIASGIPLRAKRGKRANKDILDGKPNLYLTGNEVDAFDLVTPIREALRPLHKYQECKVICNQIRMSTMWQNVHVIVDMLNTTFNIVYLETKPEVKVRKKREYTEEQRKEIGMRLAKARIDKIVNLTNLA